MSSQYMTTNICVNFCKSAEKKKVKSHNFKSTLGHKTNPQRGDLDSLEKSKISTKYNYVFHPRNNFCTLIAGVLVNSWFKIMKLI